MSYKQTKLNLKQTISLTLDSRLKFSTEDLSHLSKFSSLKLIKHYYYLIELNIPHVFSHTPQCVVVTILTNI